MSDAEIRELGRWVRKSKENALLFLELTEDDEYLRKECGIMMETETAANWKMLEQRLSDHAETHQNGKKNAQAGKRGRKLENEKPISKKGKVQIHKNQEKTGLKSKQGKNYQHLR